MNSRKSTRVLTSRLDEKIATAKSKDFGAPKIRGIFAESKRSQVTIFIIIAIVIVGAIIGFFALRNRINVSSLPASFKPVEQYYLDCISSKIEQGKEILGDKAGYIEAPEFERGNSYMPFSSQLDFQGMGVPYWMYVSGNGYIKEQVPSKSKMEQQLERYIETEIEKCDFSDFEEQGFVITRGEASADAKINDFSIDVVVNQNLNIEKENEKATQGSHKASANSKLGKMYSEALNIYNFEKQNAFLENYGVDVLRLYAPVDGVEISCSPKIWQTQKVFSELKDALEANIQAIKVKGTYYTSDDSNKYFVVKDISTENAVNFIYDRNFPSRMEVWESESNIMKAEPVGNQEGLGILGFCYVPYHFVYDAYYPVLIQIYDNQERFQFPVAIVISKNTARKALGNASVSYLESDLCKYKSQDVSVYTYDSNLNPVEASISYECLGESCNIGETKISEGNAVLNEKFPQCVNGFITAKADGFARKRQQVSTNTESIADIVLNRLYNVSVDFRVNAEESSDYAIVSFVSEENSQTMVWPEQKQVQLSEGSYNISVYVYRNASITIPGVKKEQCMEVNKPGILGIFGQTEEKCFNVDIPAQTLSNLPVAGGKTSDYFTEDRLEKGKIKINTNSIPIASSVEQLQDSYNLLEVNPVYVE